MEKYRTPVGKSSSVYRRTPQRPPVNSSPPGKPPKNEDPRFTRSSSYRKQFLKERRGLFGTRMYVCAYCGRLISPDTMQVDHCIPVDAAKKKFWVRMYIRFLGMFQRTETRNQGINGVWNLVPACHKCNRDKSNLGGMWVVRGAFGRFLFPVLWYLGIAAVGLMIGQWLLFGQGPLAAVVGFLSQFGGLLSGI